MTSIPSPAAVLCAFGFAFASPGNAQQPLRASLRALSPIAAEWLNAPPGTPGALVTHPPGTLTSADVHAMHALSDAHLALDLTTDGTAWSLLVDSEVLAAFGDLFETRADLRLVLTAPANTVLDLDVRVQHFGDQPSPYGMQIDVGDDGTFDLTTNTTVCCGTVHRRVWSWNFADGPLPVRITHRNTTGASPQSFHLALRATPWAARTAPTGPASGLVGDLTTPVSTYTTDYRLAALPPPAPGGTSTLRATGLGEWHAFVLAPTGKTAAFVPPLPFVGGGDLFARIDLLATGIVTSTTTTASEWQLDVPALPPGLELHLQHMSARLTAPWLLGVTEPIVLRT